MEPTISAVLLTTMQQITITLDGKAQRAEVRIANREGELETTWAGPLSILGTVLLALSQLDSVDFAEAV